MILPSNLFECDVDNTHWMKYSFFLTSYALYITQFKEIKAYIIGISALLFSTILIMKLIFKYFEQKQQNKVNSKLSVIPSSRKYAESDLNSMAMHFAAVKEYFIDKYLMLCIIILLIIACSTPNYFQCVSFVDLLSFAMYYDQDGDLSIINCLICVVWVIFMFLVSNHVYNIQINQKQDKYLSQSQQRTDINMHRGCTLWISFTFWLLLYLLLIALLIIYIASSSLPTDNLKDMHRDWQIEGLQKSMSFILTISNTLIVPQLVANSYKLFTLKEPENSSRFLSTYRPTFIFILRSFTTIILPLTMSLLFLNDCGRLWTSLWTKCPTVGGQDSELDIITQIPFTFQSDNGYDIFSFNQSAAVQLQSSGDICSPKGWTQINWNKCLRSFYSEWVIILIQKVIIMQFMPILIIGFKMLIWKISQFVHSDEIRSKIQKKSSTLKIDGQYTMILNKLETMIVYSFVFPLLYPLTIISIISNVYFYGLITSEKGTKIFGTAWVFSPNDQNLNVQIYLLWIAILVGQILMTLFAFITFESAIFAYCMMSVWIVLDIFYMVKLFQFSQNQYQTQQPLMEMMYSDLTDL
eukprot:539120_1